MDGAAPNVVEAGVDIRYTHCVDVVLGWETRQPAPEDGSREVRKLICSILLLERWHQSTAGSAGGSRRDPR